MAFNLATLDQVMDDWLGDSQAWLAQLSKTPNLDNLTTAGSTDLVRQAREAFPNTELSVFGRDGRLIASNAAVPPQRPRSPLRHGATPLVSASAPRQGPS